MLHRGAEQDLVDAFRFYRREAGDGVARRFLHEFERAMKILEEFPELGKPAGEDRRVLPLTGFPYSVIYRSVKSEIRVLVLRHQNRDPDYGNHRL